MLMFVYGIDADEAFAMLRRQSQDRNVKLRFIAEQVIRELLELSKSQPSARRLASDGAHLTARLRVTSSAERTPALRLREA
jgi:hypothetical protein